MKLILSLTAAITALAFAPAAMAGGEGQESVAAGSSGDIALAHLIAFNGEFELLKTSRRLRIWRSHIAYRLTAGAQGNATGCEVTERFRRTYVNDSLCEILMQHHTFEPAHDFAGVAIEGSYAARLSYTDMRANR
jgi:hypothetical protein